MNIRAFFALPLKQAVVRRLADHADTLCAFDLRGQVLWSDSDNYHLTLCFLGDVSLEQVVALEQLALEQLTGSESFQVHLNAAEYIRVNPEQALLAALAESSPELLALQQRVLGLVRGAGIEVQGADYNPHVTLGRLDAALPFDAPQSWPTLDLLNLADAVVLYQSKPTSGGSIYSPLFEIALGSRNEGTESLAQAKAI